MDCNDSTAGYSPTQTREPEWIGPRTFAARFGDAGTDHYFGTRWGERRDQRISLRGHPGSEGGLLYAYDSTWDEYAVRADDVPQTAVEAAFIQALDVDTHMHVLAFAELARRHQILGTRPLARSVHHVLDIEP
ncbi:hypothetical protein [Pedococcus sp. 5OH_020]|uniref:hypothetical protein n=1 Tax=Pedococcus sp. 5OH_020 TaxID=2989814 RepID=UPI0022E9CC14|nr:hypothetical protein [Pedococcus sp. 5OH_020]